MANRYAVIEHEAGTFPEAIRLGNMLEISEYSSLKLINVLKSRILE